MRRAVSNLRSVRRVDGIVHLAIPAGIVLILTLSLLVALRASPVTEAGSTGTSAPMTAVAAASRSLGLGEGPAGGAPMACASTGTTTSCSSTIPPNAYAGGVGWGNVTGRQSSAPMPRSYGRSLAYDPQDHYVVLFGGFTGTGYLSDTWTFANGTWTQLSPPRAPSARDHSTLVWDPADGYLLLFGGSGTGGEYGDTWSFVSGNWTPHTESTAPSGRWSASMTYDAADGYVVLFGGCRSGSEQSDTWKYVGGNWTHLFPNPHPDSRGDAGMTYDPADGYVLLFGGYDQGSAYEYYNDTWTFLAGNWTEIAPPVSPSPRTSPAFAYDPWLGGVVLFGGQSASYADLADTWFYSNGTWTLLPTSASPPAREFGIMATDPLDGYLVLFGGAGTPAMLNDTWVLYTMNASANASTTRGTAPLTVEFSGHAVDPFAVGSYRWSFGDEDAGSGDIVNHTYAQSGFFLATLTVADANGVQGLATVGITVIPGLSLVAVASANGGAAPLNVSWAASAAGGVAPYSWGWTVDGTLFATTENASHVFVEPGLFRVVVTATDSAHAAVTQAFAVNVSAPVVAPLTVSIFASTLVGESPLAVSLVGEAQGGVPGYTGTWSFGDGTHATGMDANHWFNTSGGFTVAFTAVDARGSAAATRAVLTVIPAVSVTARAGTANGSAPFDAAFSASSNGGVGPFYYLWSFGDGGSATGSDVTHLYVRSGAFAASVEVVDSLGHNATSHLTITVGLGTSAPPVTAGSGAEVNPTAVVVGAELAVGALAVAALVRLFRRRA